APQSAPDQPADPCDPLQDQPAENEPDDAENEGNAAPALLDAPELLHQRVHDLDGFLDCPQPSAESRCFRPDILDGLGELAPACARLLKEAQHLFHFSFETPDGAISCGVRHAAPFQSVWWWRGDDALKRI